MNSQKEKKKKERAPKTDKPWWTGVIRGASARRGSHRSELQRLMGFKAVSGETGGLANVEDGVSGRFF